VGARLGQRAVYSWKVQVPQTSGLLRCVFVSLGFGHLGQLSCPAPSKSELADPGGGGS
jgi:hypothetical protein